MYLTGSSGTDGSKLVLVGHSLETELVIVGLTVPAGFFFFALDSCTNHFHKLCAQLTDDATLTARHGMKSALGRNGSLLLGQ